MCFETNSYRNYRGTTCFLHPAWNNDAMNWADISDWVETTNHDVVEFSHRKLMFSRGFVCHQTWGLVLGNLKFITKLLEPRATQFFVFALCFCQYYANWEWLYDHRILWGWHRHTCTHTNTRLYMVWCVYIYIYIDIHTLKIVHIYNMHTCACAHVFRQQQQSFRYKQFDETGWNHVYSQYDAGGYHLR